jgi:DNA-binding response OmpR family regulator
MRSYRLLLLVESAELSGILQLALAQHELESYPRADQARDAVRRRFFDLAIVDCSHSSSAAVHLIRDWRQGGSEFPIIVLSDLPHPSLAVEVMAAGADDFLRKPYHHAELVARMGKLLTRRAGTSANPLRRTAGIALGSSSFIFGGSVVTPELIVRFPDGAEERLRPKQHGILKFFADRAGGLALKEELVREVWGTDGNQLSHSVNEYVSTLRRLFTAHGIDFNRLVVSEPKVGWRIDGAAAGAAMAGVGA